MLNLTYLSTFVLEKLLTYWLSIGLYNYLKEQTDSELFILYKAIKIQVEKGPVDYITACAKYTLSEYRLFTDTDTEDPKQLVEVTVLDCDTITHLKSKMLEILYKNVGYSMRPPLHTTVLDIIGTNLLTKLHEHWKITVASRVLTRKNAPPPGSHVFQPTGIIF
ncbi:hypothetical protein DPMN_027381 [Dreissena polymorpha]|uniref:Plexin cytoplasmic RasGAP domain-containing protein n=1 Tax=Dreissena polymorpha TaxID=45954 RepID=A0A9D4LV34_DREPO|nr:hypothetical protein DPMN_027381 [Dreissena polymorpha]